MKHRLNTPSLPVIFALCLAVAGFAQANPDAAPARAYPAFWSLTLPTADGDSVALKPYRGKYLLVNFWGEWCATCVQEIPFLLKLNAKYGKGGKDRLRILGLLKSEDLARAKSLIRKSGMAWPQLMLTRDVETGFAIRKFPTNILISPAGEIVMEGFSHHFRDFKRRMGDYDSVSVIRESEIKAAPAK